MGARGAPQTPTPRVAAAAAGAVGLVLATLLASTLGAPIAQTPTRDWERPSPIPTPSAPDPSPAMPPTSDAGSGLPQLVAVLVGGLLVLAALVLLVLLLRWLLRLRHGRRRDGAGVPKAAIPPPEVAQEVASDADLHFAALREGSPTEAIIAAWVAMERSVGRAGIERRPAETSAELTLRVLEQLAVDGTAVRTLATLYREARFSRHPITEQQRGAARAAIVRVHADLRPATEAQP